MTARVFDRRRRVGVIALLVCAGVLLPTVCWTLLGMPGLQAMLIGAVAVIVAGITRFPPDGYADEFPDPPTPERDRGARREVFRLSWNVAGRQDRVGSTLVGRLQQIARRRLADHDLRLDDPADRDRVIELLGARSYRMLTQPPGSEAGSGTFTTALAAVERLADVPTPTHHNYGRQQTSASEENR
jgi:hypothetical protein